MKGLANTDSEICKTRVWTWHFCSGPSLPMSLPILSNSATLVCKLMQACLTLFQNSSPTLADISQQINFFVCLFGTYQCQCVGHLTVDNQMCYYYYCFLPHHGLADTPHQMRLFPLAFLPILSKSTPVVLTCFTLFQNSSSQLGRYSS